MANRFLPLLGAGLLFLGQPVPVAMAAPASENAKEGSSDACSLENIVYFEIGQKGRYAEVRKTRPDLAAKIVDGFFALQNQRKERFPGASTSEQIITDKAELEAICQKLPPDEFEALVLSILTLASFAEIEIERELGNGAESPEGLDDENRDG